MKANLSWLKDYVTPGISADKLAYRLTMAGLEVEGVSKVSGDFVFEMEVTPNRADCLSIIGIAREISAILNKKCDYPRPKKSKLPTKKCDIQVLDKTGCSKYMGTVIENITVEKPSLWMKKRLEPLGLRSINNIVDITNFCLIELGQPLHAFDYDKLEGGKIIVRRAKKGEKIVTIDGVTRDLDPSILIIADAKKPVAIAGIMGGKEAEVSAKTKNILLEAAHFDPILIRRASRKLGLSSDSSYRFERGVDCESVELGSERAIHFILNESKGQITKYARVVSKQKKIKKIISVSLSRINAYLGTTLKISQVKNTLAKLGCKVTGSSKTQLLKVEVPTFRPDIKEDVDIIEEVARVIGYDNLPMTLPTVKVNKMVNLPKRKTRDNLRQALVAQGLNEILTYSLINFDHFQKSNQENLKGIKIKNPLSKDQEWLRPSLLPRDAQRCGNQYKSWSAKSKVF